MNRFFAICYPMHVKSICTTRRAQIAIPFLWIISAALSLPNAIIQVSIENIANWQLVNNLHFFHWNKFTSFRLMLSFQTETHAIPGFYCHSSANYLVSNWYAVHTGFDFFLIFIIPFGLIVHNYARICITLFKSLKENAQLKEGTDIRFETKTFKLFKLFEFAV